MPRNQIIRTNGSSKKGKLEGKVVEESSESDVNAFKLPPLSRTHPIPCAESPSRFPFLTSPS